MITKYIDKSGIEQPINSIADFVHHIESELISDSTMIFCDTRSAWKKASEANDYLSVKAHLTHSLSSAAEETQPSKTLEAPSLKESLFKRIFSNTALPWLLTTLALALYYYSEIILATNNGSLAYRIGEILGLNMILLIVGGFVAKNTVFRNIKSNSFISYATIFLSAAIYHAYASHEENEAYKSLANELKPYLTESNPPSESKRDKHIAITQTARDIDSIKDLVKQRADAQVTAAMAYGTATEQVSDILAPEIITDKIKTASALQKVDNFERAIYEYFDRLEKIHTSTREKANSLVLDTSFKNEFISGLDRGYKYALPLLDRYKKNQLALAQKYKEILSFVSGTTVSLSVENMILFPTDEEADQYNMLLKSAQALATEEEKILQEIEAHQETNLKKLEQLSQ